MAVPHDDREHGLMLSERIFASFRGSRLRAKILRDLIAESRKPVKRRWPSVVAVVTVVALVVVGAIYFRSHPLWQTTPKVTQTIRGAESVAVRLFGDNSLGKGGQWIKTHAQEWAQKTGNTLEYIDPPIDSTAALQERLKHWAAKSAEIDVYIIDVIWSGIAAPHAVNFKKYFKEAEINEHFSRIIQNNTVNGQLVSMPFFTEAGLLYYRTDLLEKYDFKEPPKSWEKLAQMAKQIQDANSRAASQTSRATCFRKKPTRACPERCPGLDFPF